MPDLWALFSVDVREVFTGSCTASWVLGFVERVFHHPESVARARLFGGDQWADWYCWGKTEAKIADGSFSPFTGPLTKADGSEGVAAGVVMTDAEIVAMDWHVKGVTTPLPK